METFSIVKYDAEYYFHLHKSNNKRVDIIGSVFACLTSENEMFVNDLFKEYLEGSLEEILNKYGFSGNTDSLIDRKMHDISLIINYNRLRDRTKKLNKFK